MNDQRAERQHNSGSIQTLFSPQNVSYTSSSRGECTPIYSENPSSTATTSNSSTTNNLSFSSNIPSAIDLPYYSSSNQSSVSSDSRHTQNNNQNPLGFLLIIGVIITTPAFIVLSSIDFSAAGFHTHLMGHKLFLIELSICIAYALLVVIALFLRSDCLNTYFNFPNSNDRLGLPCLVLIFLYFISTGALLGVLNIYLLPHIDFSSYKGVWSSWGALSIITIVFLFLCPLLLKCSIPNSSNRKIVLASSWVFLFFSVIVSILTIVLSLESTKFANLVHNINFSASMINGIALLVYILLYSNIFNCKADANNSFGFDASTMRLFAEQQRTRNYYYNNRELAYNNLANPPPPISIESITEKSPSQEAYYYNGR